MHNYSFAAGTATDDINTVMPTIVVAILYFSINIVFLDATFHSPRITDKISACPVVTIINIGHPIEAATLSGSNVVAHTPYI